MFSSVILNLILKRCTCWIFAYEIQEFLQAIFFSILTWEKVLSKNKPKGRFSPLESHNTKPFSTQNKQTQQNKPSNQYLGFQKWLAVSLTRIIFFSLLQPHIIQPLFSKQQSRFFESQRSLFAVLIAALGGSMLCYPTFFPGPGDAISYNLQAISHQFSWGANRL